jgi:hypothetical protein
MDLNVIFFKLDYVFLYPQYFRSKLNFIRNFKFKENFFNLSLSFLFYFPKHCKRLIFLKIFQFKMRFNFNLMIYL